MKCLILGGAGFIGSNLAAHLLERGVQVSVMDSQPERLAAMQARLPKLVCHCGSAEQSTFLAEIISGQDVLVYLIHTTIPSVSEEDPGYDAVSNIRMLLAVINAAGKAGVRRIVQSSSGGTVYGRANSVPISESHPTDPLCAYGISKLAIEKYVRLYCSRLDIESVVLRVANPFGPGQALRAAQGAVSVFLGRMMNGEPIEIWGDGNVVRDYIYIQDVVEAFEAAALKPLNEPHPVLNIGTGVGTSLRELIEILESVSGLRAEVSYRPARALDVPTNVLDIRYARQLLDFAPRFSLRDGLEKYWESLSAKV